MMGNLNRGDFSPIRIIKVTHTFNILFWLEITCIKKVWIATIPIRY